jgi:hypothetical protein
VEKEGEGERREGEYGMRMGSEEEMSFPGGSLCTIWDEMEMNVRRRCFLLLG